MRCERSIGCCRCCADTLLGFPCWLIWVSLACYLSQSLTNRMEGDVPGRSFRWVGLSLGLWMIRRGEYLTGKKFALSIASKHAIGHSDFGSPLSLSAALVLANREPNLLSTCAFFCDVCDAAEVMMVSFDWRWSTCVFVLCSLALSEWYLLSVLPSASSTCAMPVMIAFSASIFHGVESFACSLMWRQLSTGDIHSRWHTLVWWGQLNLSIQCLKVYWYRLRFRWMVFSLLFHLCMVRRSYHYSLSCLLPGCLIWTEMISGIDFGTLVLILGLRGWGSHVSGASWCQRACCIRILSLLRVLLRVLSSPGCLVPLTQVVLSEITAVVACNDDLPFSRTFGKVYRLSEPPQPNNVGGLLGSSLGCIYTLFAVNKILFAFVICPTLMRLSFNVGTTRAWTETECLPLFIYRLPDMMLQEGFPYAATNFLMCLNVFVRD